jgi:muramoyltetrapeptide carboxypeptidase
VFQQQAELQQFTALCRNIFLMNDGAPSENLESLMQLLKGGKASYSFKDSENNRSRKVNGEMVGGNLSIISSMQGTPCELKTDGKILILEDIDEFLYHTDRMIHQLKLSGKLDKLAGLVLGDFSEMKDNESPFGKTVHEIIIECSSGI